MKKNIKMEIDVNLQEKFENIFNAKRDNSGKGIKIDDLIALLKSQ